MVTKVKKVSPANVSQFVHNPFAAQLQDRRLDAPAQAA